MVQYSQTRRSFFSHGENCLQITFNELDWKINIEHQSHLHGSHKEADTILAFHASTVAGNAVIRASDTDVLVILLGMIGRHLTGQRQLHYYGLWIG